MKKIILVFSLVFLTSFVFSQIESGTINYSITSNWMKMNASVTYIPHAAEDAERMNYVFGDNRGYTEYAELFFNDSVYSFQFKDDDEMQTRKKTLNIYRNYKNNTSYDLIELLNKKYLINDTVVSQNWKIKNNMKEIAGHICMNAIYNDTIKEQQIEAWFALDMPLPIGPDIYSGLPGVILEINKCNGALVYTATSIIPANENITIKKPEITKKINSISANEYNKLLWEKYQESKKQKRPYFWTIGF